jgi:hypothetical protein
VNLDSDEAKQVETYSIPISELSQWIEVRSEEAKSRIGGMRYVQG